MFRKLHLGLSIASLAVAAVLGIATPVHAQNTEAGIKAGILKCDVASGFGFIFGSSKDLKCVYSPDNAGDSQRYTGKIQKFGVDVFVPSVKLPAHVIDSVRHSIGDVVPLADVFRQVVKVHATVFEAFD